MADLQSASSSVQPLPTSPDAPEVLKISITPKSSLTTKFVVLAFWALLVYLAVQLFMVWYENQVIIKWWQTGTGPDKSLNDCMSIWLILVAGQRSKLLYWLVSLFLPLLVGLAKAQIEFVTGTLFKFVRLDTPEGQTGIMLPRHMCVTVLLCRDDGDSKFNAWLETHRASRFQVVDDPTDSSAALTFGGASMVAGRDGKTLSSYTDPKPLKDKGGKFGVYPASDDTEAWKGCIQAWANGGLNSGVVNFAWDNVDGLWTLSPTKDAPSDAGLDAWFDTDKQPDNVFARYHLTPQSPLLTYFVSGFDKTPQGGSADPTAFKHLVSGASGKGGWIGFMKNVGGESSSEGTYEDNCFAKAYIKPNSTPPNSACRNGWGNAALSGGVAGLGILAFLPMLTEVAPIIGTIALAVVMFGLVGAQTKMSPC